MSQRQEEQRELFDFEADESLLTHIGTVDESDPRYAGVLSHLYALFARTLSGQHDDMAEALVMELSRHFGGVQFYMPRGRALMTHMKHIQIWNEFNGRNINELAIKHDLTTKQIYQIVAKQRRREQRARQGDLFVSR